MHGIAVYLGFQISLLLGTINCVKNIIDKNNKILKNILNIKILKEYILFLVYYGKLYLVWFISVIILG